MASMAAASIGPTAHVASTRIQAASHRSLVHRALRARLTPLRAVITTSDRRVGSKSDGDWRSASGSWRSLLRTYCKNSEAAAWPTRPAINRRVTLAVALAVSAAAAIRAAASQVRGEGQ